VWTWTGGYGKSVRDGEGRDVLTTIFRWYSGVVQKAHKEDDYKSRERPNFEARSPSLPGGRQMYQGVREDPTQAPKWGQVPGNVSRCECENQGLKDASKGLQVSVDPLQPRSLVFAPCSNSA
jgi:hypothetical protein